MAPRVTNVMLSLLLAGAVSGAVAQEDCSARIGQMAKIGDFQAALSCVDNRIGAESERTRVEAEKNRKLLLSKITEFDIVTANVRNIALKEATAGNWKEIPDSQAAHVCFLSSVRLPQQGLCQISYQGSQEHWAYNISDPKSAGFICTATCVWMGLAPKPQPKE
jgi:hypothetical protein